MDFEAGSDDFWDSGGQVILRSNLWFFLKDVFKYNSNGLLSQPLSSANSLPAPPLTLPEADVRYYVIFMH